MDNNKMIKVTNISVGSLGYTLPELHIKRHFTPKETKEISFGELFALYNSEGGRALILNKLAVKDKAAIEIDSTFNEFVVTINNSKAEGFANGNVSGNSLWNNKNGSLTTVIVDGETKLSK